MVAAKNIKQEGWLATKLTPFVPRRVPYFESAGLFYYTHYPPLPYYIGGLLRQLGLNNLADYKLVNFLIGSLVLLTFFHLVSQMLNPTIALGAALLFGSHPLFLYSMLETPTLWDHLFSFLAFFAFYKALKTQPLRPKRSLLATTWALVFLSSFSSAELFVANLVFITSYSLYKQGLSSKVLKTLGFFASASFLSFALHLLTNAWALGGIKAAMQDIFNAFLWRSVGITPEHQQAFGNIGGISYYPLKLLESIKYSYYQTYIGIVGIVILFLRLWYKHRSNIFKRYLAILTIFALTNMSFWFIFPQLTLSGGSMHTLHWLPTYSLMIAGLAYFAIKKIKLFTKPSRTIGLVIGLFLVLIGVIWPTLTRNSEKARLLNTSEGIWIKEVSALRQLSRSLPSNANLITPDEGLLRAAFYHQPREVFGLSDFRIYYAADEKQLKEKAIHLTSPVYYLPTITGSPVIIKSD